jgi:hypothetical protein
VLHRRAAVASSADVSYCHIEKILNDSELP